MVSPASGHSPGVRRIRPAIRAGTPWAFPRREAPFDAFRRLTPHVALKGFRVLGLDDGSPRTRVGVGVVYWPD